MPVFHDHKIVFFHIGKTGGFSVEKALGIGQLDYRVFDEHWVHGLNKGVMTQHARPGYVKQMVGDEIFREYFKFTVVRNPWNRMVSAYNYLINMHQKRFESFEKWLEHKHEMVIRNKYKEGSHYIPQVEYLTDSAGNPCCNQVIRFEALSDGFNNICDGIGIKASLPHLNKSKHGSRGMYTEHTKTLVNEMYENDIERFNYKFERGMYKK